VTGLPPDVDLHAPLAGASARGAAAFSSALGPVTSVAVAFSGGVDSSVTAALAARVVGCDAVVAIIGVSPSLAADELVQARRTARAIGVELVEVATYEMDDERYVANAGNRCYFCKHELYTRAFADAVTARACDVLVNGDTADDHASGDRPGRRAAVELGVRSPLAEAGIDKSTVRELARALGLPVWDKPSAPCLASRVPVHTPVTIEGLGRIERAESSLRDLGLRVLRVRHRGPDARVELGEADLAAVQGRALRARVVAAVRAAGYDHVDVAPVPLRRG
jgi:uncharacterized protein